MKTKQLLLGALSAFATLPAMADYASYDCNQDVTIGGQRITSSQLKAIAQKIELEDEKKARQYPDHKRDIGVGLRLVCSELADETKSDSYKLEEIRHWQEWYR